MVFRKDIEPPPPSPPRLENLSSCPLCADTALIAPPAQPEPPLGLLQCGKCGVIFLSPRPAHGGIQVHYGDYYASQDRPDERETRRAQQHLQRLMRSLPRPGRLLEIGAGDGYFVKAARDSGWQAEGLELAQPRIANAKNWFGIGLHCMNLAEANFPPESFEAISLFQVLERLRGPRETLQRIHKLLKPGGVVQLSTPNVLACAGKKLDANSWQIPRNLFFFTPGALLRLVESVGFKPLSRSLKSQAKLEASFGPKPWVLGTPVMAEIGRSSELDLIAKKDTA